ncbi:metallophosphoesterase [bacterium]|nr:metallophosphoesterase [bacterium]
MKIIHISDLQYQASSRKDEIHKFIQKIINHYSETSEKPLIIYTGDLVEDALKSEMTAHRAQLQELVDAGFEMLICPGNHDQKKNGFNVRFTDANLTMFSNIFSDLLPQGKHYYSEDNNNLLRWPLVHQYGSYYFIGLDSNEGMHNNYSACGKIERRQRYALKKAIKEIRKKDSNAVIVVYLHHEPFEYTINTGVPGPWDYQFMKLKKREKLLRILKGRVNVLLFGHNHNFDRKTSQEQKWKIDLILRNAGAIMNVSDHKFVEIDLANGFELKHI